MATRRVAVKGRWIVGAVLIGFGFAGVGLAATTFMRSFVDFDYVNMAMIPLFLFSATFFPLVRYPSGLQAIIRCTPLYQGVVLERSRVRVGRLRGLDLPLELLFGCRLRLGRPVPSGIRERPLGDALCTLTLKASPSRLLRTAPGPFWD